MIDSLLLKEFDSIGVSYEPNFALSDACTFKIGGTCKLALFPSSAEQIALCADLLDRHSEPFCVVGKGSNTLFFDGYVDKMLIFTSGASGVSIDGELVTAEAGVALIPLCARLARESLGGMEFAAGIPGSVGGAMYMNAGAYGRAMSDVVVASRAFDRRSGSIVTLHSHDFGYRESVYHKDKSLICLEVKLRVAYSDKEQILSTMRELSDKRRSTQPLEYPSAGSYFKRPDGDFAGRLIEAAGLKGTSCGGACVSEKHAGFIINRGSATFEDVVSLEELVRARVLENFGVTLRREVEIIK